jgi:hypothetical protein
MFRNLNSSEIKEGRRKEKNKGLSTSERPSPQFIKPIHKKNPLQIGLRSYAYPGAYV